MRKNKKHKRSTDETSKFTRKLISWSKKCIGSKNKLCRFFSFPLAIFILSEYKLEVFGYRDIDTSENSKPSRFHHRQDAQKLKGEKYNSFKLKYVALQIISGHSIKESKFKEILYKAHPKKKLRIISILMDGGSLKFARIAVHDLIENHIEYFSDKDRYDIYNRAAVIAFLQGYNKEACLLWEKYGKVKNKWKFPRTPRTYRILGNDWFAAIGHVAMLDYYYKHKKLYAAGPYRIVSKSYSQKNDLTRIIYRKFFELGMVSLDSKNIKKDFDKWQTAKGSEVWSDLIECERESFVDDFWSYEFPDGKILGYAHGASRIQKDWENANYEPLLKVSDEEKKWLDEYKEVIGLPKDVWYVCLHVREAGYYKSWNKLYPTVRDAKIETYTKAIQEITDAGGWVIRMGDPSMQPLLDLPNVIDYAHSPHRLPYADLLFPATCKFFIGTNSGYATIPVIFGTPCALTNWVPIGWPLWPSQDLMITKLFKNKKTQRYLSLEELFRTGLAFLQNVSDLPSDIEIVENSPEEILQLVKEMLDACVFNKIPLKIAGASRSVIEGYEALAKKYETFTGSRFGKHFVEQNPQVFDCLSSKPVDAIRLNTIKPLSDSTFKQKSAEKASFRSKERA